MSFLGRILPVFGLEKIKVPENVRATRLKTCVDCPAKKYFKPTGSCLVCGCFCREKVELTFESCPKGHWGEYKY